tara:strand:- start:193 stop:471 length:279 start_codon:yes stop_codon:yes gene_type:complete
MDDNLDSLLKLLKEATISQNLDHINTIQENLQKVTHLIKVDIENNNINIKDDKIIKKINLVKDYIDSLEKMNKTKLKIFSEFNSFIENRKIK